MRRLAHLLAPSAGALAAGALLLALSRLAPRAASGRAVVPPSPRRLEKVARGEQYGMGPDEARMCADGACPPIGGFDACEDPDGAGGACMCPPDTAYNAFALNKEGACSCSQICMPRALVKVASTNGVWYGGPSAGLCTAQPTMRNCTSVSKGRTFGVTFFIYRCDGTSPTGSHAPLTNGSADPLLGSCEAPHGGVGASRAHGAHLRARASSAAPDGSRTHSPHNRSRWAGAADAGLVLECDRTPVPADDGAGAGAGAGGNASGTRGAPGSRGARRLPSCDELRTKGIDVGPVDGKQRLLGASRSGAESARSASGGGGAHERASRHARARARARAARPLPGGGSGTTLTGDSTATHARARDGSGRTVPPSPQSPPAAPPPHSPPPPSLPPPPVMPPCADVLGATYCQPRAMQCGRGRIARGCKHTCGACSRRLPPGGA